MEDEKSIHQRAAEWIIRGETGASSETIWAVMMGAVTDENLSAACFSPPRDPSDFRRCRLLLELIPEWRPRLGEVADLFPEWSGLVKAWDELDALYDEEATQDRVLRLYYRMKELRSS